MAKTIIKENKETKPNVPKEPKKPARVQNTVINEPKDGEMIKDTTRVFVALKNIIYGNVLYNRGETVPMEEKDIEKFLECNHVKEV